MIMDIVVSDTNIFIDLMSVGLFGKALDLPIRVHTVEYVINEIVDEGQKVEIEAAVLSGKLVVKDFDEEEFKDVLEMLLARRNNVSFTDCSVWYYAKKNNYRLLTGDGKLRRSAIADGVQVSGILYVTDMLVDNGLIGQEDMIAILERLKAINSRLPVAEINKRINKYRGLL